MIKWEYKVIRIADASAEKIEERLKELGDAGWEMVQVESWELCDVVRLYVKRKVKK